MNDQGLSRLARIAPLAGAGYAVATVASDLTIGKFPDSGTPTSSLAAFYAAHHVRVAVGGIVLAWGTLLLAAFACALWDRMRRGGAHPVLGAAVLVGAAAAVVSDLNGANTYWILGHVSTEADVTPAALQAWHIAGSEGGLAGGVAILLLAVGVAGALSRTVPRWLAWPALVLALLQMTPIGFFASLAFLLWAVVAGVVLAVRPFAGEPTGRTAPIGAAALSER